MAMLSASSARLERVYYVPLSLRRVQLWWRVRRENELGGPLTVHVSIIGRYGNEVRQWMCQRAGPQDVDDVYELPSHLYRPGHRYNVVVKLMSRDHSCTEDDSFDEPTHVLDKKTLNFRLREYDGVQKSSKTGTVKLPNHKILHHILSLFNIVSCN